MSGRDIAEGEEFIVITRWRRIKYTGKLVDPTNLYDYAPGANDHNSTVWKVVSKNVLRVVD